MKFKIVTIGKIKNKNLLSEILEIKKRTNNIEFIELKDFKDKNIEIIKKKECEEIIKNVKKNEFKILLWEFGEEFTTENFYNKIKKINSTEITFIITGAYGANEDLKKFCDMKLSLSQLTMTHEMAKLVLVEQLYRINCYSKNIPYTK